MLAVDLNRRALFAGLAASTAIAAAPAVAGTSVDSTASAWSDALDRYKRAHDAAEAYWHSEYQLYLQAHRLNGECPPRYFEYTNREGKVFRWPVDLTRDADQYFPPILSRLHEEAKQRILEWRARMQSIEDDPINSGRTKRMDVLWEAENEARLALMNHPAPHLTALALKVTLSLDQDEVWDNEKEAILADAKRLSVG